MSHPLHFAPVARQSPHGRFYGRFFCAVGMFTRKRFVPHNRDMIHHDIPCPLALDQIHEAIPRVVSYYRQLYPYTDLTFRMFDDVNATLEV